MSESRGLNGRQVDVVDGDLILTSDEGVILIPGEEVSKSAAEKGHPISDEGFGDDE